MWPSATPRGALLAACAHGGGGGGGGWAEGGGVTRTRRRPQSLRRPRARTLGQQLFVVVRGVFESGLDRPPKVLRLARSFPKVRNLGNLEGSLHKSRKNRRLQNFKEILKIFVGIF